MLTYRLTCKLWKYPGAAAWYFVTLPKGPAGEIRDMTSGPRRGWGSVPVEVTVGDTTWTTSIFPDSKSGSYVLPVKAEVRRAENLAEGDRVTLRLTVRP